MPAHIGTLTRCFSLREISRAPTLAFAHLRGVAESAVHEAEDASEDQHDCDHPQK